jgi:hypothetical protein
MVESDRGLKFDTATRLKGLKKIKEISARIFSVSVEIRTGRLPSINPGLCLPARYILSTIA